MKMIINESSKVNVKVMDENNKVIEKISVGKRAKIETVKELAARYNIEVVDYMWKINGIGGAGLYNSMNNVNFNEFMNTFAN